MDYTNKRNLYVNSKYERFTINFIDGMTWDDWFNSSYYDSSLGLYREVDGMLFDSDGAWVSNTNAKLETSEMMVANSEYWAYGYHY